MNQEERFEIIAFCRKGILLSLAEEVRKTLEIKIVKQNTALVMMQVKDSVEREIFNLGEVLVSEALVEINGVWGYTQVLGDDLEKAQAGAILDAACEAKYPLTEKIVEKLNEEKDNYHREKAGEYAKIKSTRVKFEVMD